MRRPWPLSSVRSVPIEMAKVSSTRLTMLHQRFLTN